MINDLNNINYEEELRLAFSEYAILYGDQIEVPFNIIIARNMLETYLQLSNDEQERDYWRADSDRISKLNGSVYFPTSFDDKFNLIVNATRFNEFQIHYQTITHEYTHILDFFEYSRALGVSNLLREENIPNFECIHFYSEVRARFRSTLLYYNIISLDRQEAPSILKSLANEFFKELTDNFQQDYYSLAQFYGQYLALVRYSCLQIQKPDWLHHYNNEKLWDFLDKNIDNKKIFPQFYDFLAIFYANQL